MRASYYRIALATILVLELHGMSPTARGEGFRNPPPGAAGLALGGARVAAAEGAEATLFNPAAICGARDSELGLFLTIARLETDFIGFDGRRGSSEADWQLLPNFGFVLPLARRGTAVGFSLSTPFGQSSKWDPNGPFRYQAPHSARLEFSTAAISIASPIAENFFVGLSAGVSGSRLKFTQALPWALMTGLPAPDGEAIIEADGVGLGAAVGLTWNAAPGHRAGAAYRSPIRVKYEGDLELTRFPGNPALPPPLSSITAFDDDLSTTLTFPDIAAAGYAWTPIEGLTLEADVEWIQWSRYGDPEIRSPTVGSVLPPRPPNEWKNTWNAAVGVSWDVHPAWTLRAGYTQIRSPIPDRSFSPYLPDSDRTVYSIGAGYRRGAHHLQIAVAFGPHEDRLVTPDEAPPLAGRYEFSSQIVSLSYNVRFR